MQLRRKWSSLPLLFMFPVIIVGLAAAIIITYFIPSENETVQVGLVNLDENEQTELIVQLIEHSSQLGSFIEIHSMTENEAKIAIENNEISAYITFPDNFTSHLMQGQSVEIPVTGNAKQHAESFMVNELIESVSRHIRASQANILAINSYAREFNMDDEERNDFVFEQFKEFLFYTVGRDRVLMEREITNLATSSPIQYFTVGSWFILVSIWLLAIYIFTKENPTRLKIGCDFMVYSKFSRQSQKCLLPSSLQHPLLGYLYRFRNYLGGNRYSGGLHSNYVTHIVI